MAVNKKLLTGSRMPQDLKEELFLSERRLRVADLYLIKHKSQKQIAAELGVSQTTISRDIECILEEYAMRRQIKIEKDRNITEAKLNAVEREAWEAWERSIGRVSRITKRRDGQGVLIEEVEQIDELPGDPRFLTQVQTAIDRRIKLLGLDAPQEVLLNTVEGRLIRLIQEEKVAFDMLSSDVGKDMARRYFNMAGVPVPDIIEGSIIDVSDGDDGEDLSGVIGEG